VNDELSPSKTKNDSSKKGFGSLGLLGLLVVLFSKFKFLLFGLFKIKTLLSMLLFFGVYWNQWGWPFALGFVISIYIHEMGHVAALKHYGIEASAPMFIPFVGAFVRVKQAMPSLIEDSRVGLAGPFWGLGAAIASYGLYSYFQEGIFLAIARTGAWINLFNLLPFWQLDGGRGFRSLDRTQRWMAFALIGLTLYLTREYLLLALLGFALYQALRKEVPEEPDTIGFLQYVFLVFTLSAMCLIHVPGTTGP
jgi:Zn-dependent protease